jgi:hypothetical protein
VSSHQKSLVLNRLAKVILEDTSNAVARRANDNIAEPDVVSRARNAASSSNQESDPDVGEAMQHVPGNCRGNIGAMLPIGANGHDDEMAADLAQGVGVVIVTG